jgi:hypothetical protein
MPFRFLKTAFLFFLFRRAPKCLLKGLAVGHVHARTAGFLYSDDALRRAVSGQHPVRLHVPLVTQHLTPLGFCCGGFTSTAGYVPGNEALTPEG